VQIERMITNLLSNALKFTPEGGAVKMSLLTQPLFVELVVEDNGHGIPTEHLPHIFDRFYKAEASRSDATDATGSGLGLSIVKTIVERHGGRIGVRSRPGVETAFEIVLPDEDAAADADG
jgi:two-component system OmpR family sensor kinase